MSKYKKSINRMILLVYLVSILNILLVSAHNINLDIPPITIISSTIFPLFEGATGLAKIAGSASTLTSAGFTGSAAAQATSNIMSGQAVTNNVFEAAVSGAKWGGLIGGVAGGFGAIKNSVSSQHRIPSLGSNGENTPSFQSRALLQSHFDSHGLNLGYKTASAYEEGARDFLTGLPKPGTAEMIRPGDMAIVRYQFNTQKFGVLDADGTTIRTFFKPYDNPVNGYNYYLKQMLR